jgi:hypothetical protein
MMKREDMDKVSKITDLWIDIGAATKDEARARVRVGDAAVLDAAVQELPNGRIVSRSIDNRIGAYVVAEALRLLSTERPKHAGVFAVATTREEIAWSGGGARTSAVEIDPQVALVVDVTHGISGAEKKRAGEHKIGGGPVLSADQRGPVVFGCGRVPDAERSPSIRGPARPGTDADSIYRPRVSHRPVAFQPLCTARNRLRSRSRARGAWRHSPARLRGSFIPPKVALHARHLATSAVSAIHGRINRSRPQSRRLSRLVRWLQ